MQKMDITSAIHVELRNLLESSSVDISFHVLISRQDLMKIMRDRSVWDVTCSVEGKQLDLQKTLKEIVVHPSFETSIKGQGKLSNGERVITKKRLPITKKKLKN